MSYCHYDDLQMWIQKITVAQLDKAIINNHHINKLCGGYCFIFFHL